MIDASDRVGLTRSWPSICGSGIGSRYGAGIADLIVAVVAFGTRLVRPEMAQAGGTGGDNLARAAVHLQLKKPPGGAVGLDDRNLAGEVETMQAAPALGPQPMPDLPARNAQLGPPPRSVAKARRKRWIGAVLERAVPGTRRSFVVRLIAVAPAVALAVFVV